ncbi:MAG: lipopolysaccharide transport periplasmic protein LptA [Woeseiaceae bacterium]|nr:lipopolysaccharide transport periplasmic protein LptA [Woeseiaceae bacterium]
MLAALFSCAAGAQIGDLRLPISLDADSTDYDGKSSMLMFEGLRLSQGNMGVQADRGLASKLDFEDSVWQFRGNVVIDTGSGRIRCDSADLSFSGHQLRFATIQGSPATFELRREASEETTYAEAGRLDYDFEAGIVEFSEDAVISEGGNRISSNYLVYNIREQRINAQSSGNGDPRVKITYTPRPPDDDDVDSTSPAAADQPAEPPEDEPGAGGT